MAVAAKFCPRTFKSALYKSRSISIISLKNYSSRPQELSAISNWESVVGLEVHAQINAKSKLFSRASTAYGAPTNCQVSYFDASIPGTLPVLNKYCVEAAVLTALAFSCKVNKVSTFDRKHYFYSDLPAGYQITQQIQPLASGGFVEFVMYNQQRTFNPYTCSVRMKQLQLEQDSGRSLHTNEGKSLIDLNRSGIGLMELVFEPDLKNGEEAAKMVKELQLILTRIGTCSCVMEEGALRIDANISVNRVGEPFGVRTEVKNINSIRHLARAVDSEIDRQIKILESGNYVINETRAFDYETKKTFSMRDKEAFQDYRFMPEPNLPPIQLFDDSDCHLADSYSAINIDDLSRKLSSLPAQDREHLTDVYHLPIDIVDKIVQHERLKEMYEVVAAGIADKNLVAAILLNNVKHQLNSRNLTYKTCPVNDYKIKDVLLLLHDKVISDATANDLFDILFNGDPRTAGEIVDAYNWKMISDENSLEKLCLKVLRDKHKLAKKYRKSQKQRHMTELLKAVNEEVQNRANIKLTESVLIRLLSNENKKNDN